MIGGGGLRLESRPTRAWPRWAIGLAHLLFSATPAWAQADARIAAQGDMTGSAGNQQDAGRRSFPCPKTPFRYVRHDEDFGFLRNPNCRSGPLDKLKYIPLADDGRVYLSLGGEMRQRYQRFGALDFGSSGFDGNGAYQSRYYAFADLRGPRGWRAFVQLRHAIEAGFPGPPRPVQDGGPDIHEAFVEVPIAEKAFIRVGRQEISYPTAPAAKLSELYDTSRLLGLEEFFNIQYSFDAVLASVPLSPGWRMNAFYARPVRPKVGSFDDGSNSGRQFWGANAEGSTGVGLGFYLYYFGLQDRAAVIADGAPDLRHTLGAQITTMKPLLGWTFDGEAALQRGRSGGRRVRAGFAALDAKYAIPLAPWKATFLVRTVYASGDSDPTDGKVETFNSLFTSGFTDIGLVNDMVNLIEWQLGVIVQPSKRLRIRVSYEDAYRASRRDGAYAYLGGPYRDGPASRARRLSGNAALDARYQATTHIDFRLLAGRSFAGRFIKQSGPRRETGLVRFEMRYRL